MGDSGRTTSRSAGDPDEFRWRLGQNIRKLRRARGLSQEQLAEAAGLHRGTIHVLENGHREPRASTIVRLSAALECDPSAFYEGIEWIPGAPAGGGTFRFDSPHERPSRQGGKA